jgi:hypothetical protein
MQAQEQIIGEISYALILYANVQGLHPRSFYTITVSEDANEHDQEMSIELQKEQIRQTWNLTKEAKQSFRQCSSELLRTTNSIKLYGFWTKVGLVIPLKNVISASSELIGLSNTVGNPDGSRSISDRRIKLISLLKIDILAAKYGIDAGE